SRDAAPAPAPTRRATTTSAPAGGGVGPGAGAAATTPVEIAAIEAELKLAQVHYDRALASLERLAAAGQAGLDPAAVAAVRRNLEVIDRTITESRAALDRDPQNEAARESLFEAVRRRVGLLQDTLALINEMRKGNQAGAAQILEGLEKS
ncbi:MAG TPA: hypothetical protein VNI83_10140, partial [Vicinamibacterales bacterium]|nr:hypothetical protein [Vicinamibacterales bacterium]